MDDEDEQTSLELLADYECPDCGPMEEVAADLLLTEDEATAIFAGDEKGNWICPNEWCDEELDLTAGAAAANLAWVTARLSSAKPSASRDLGAGT